MQQHKLSTDDLKVIKATQQRAKELIVNQRQSEVFSVGDHLIIYSIAGGYETSHGTAEISKEICKNSYGAPKKYVVVHVDNVGIRYCRLINSKGVPQGPLLSCIGEGPYDEEGLSLWRDSFEFAIDPDFADALIMDDRENFDATATQRHKKAIRDEITKFNKAHKVLLGSNQDCLNFTASLKPGDTFWTSSKKSYIVQSIKSETSLKSFYPCYFPRGTTVHRVTLLSNTGKTFERTTSYFFHKAVYRQRPRSYKELNEI